MRFWRIIVSVSYTHLDVYKRQKEDLPIAILRHATSKLRPDESGAIDLTLSLIHI